MKKALATSACALAVVSLVFFVTGCATPYPMGALYTEVKLPVGGGSSKAASPKVGISQCQSVLGLLATGDASFGNIWRCQKWSEPTVMSHEYINTWGL